MTQSTPGRFSPRENLSDVPRVPWGTIPRWSALVTSLVIGLILLVSGLAISGGFLGPDAQTTGQVTALDGGHPIIAYSVDGQTYQTESGAHGGFTTGESIDVCYSPANPTRAETCSARQIGTVFNLVGGVGIMAGVVVAILIFVQHRRWVRTVQAGHVVSATLTGARRNAQIHRGSLVVWYLGAQWQDPVSHEMYDFESRALWSDISPLERLIPTGVTTVPVFIDPGHPGKDYFVDLRRVRTMLSQQR